MWASPWVVPAWMMDSASNMKSDAQTLGAHALYMARFVEEYAKEGVTIEAIHPQNEPGYARVHWTQTLFINFIKTYLGPTLAQRNLDAEIWCGTMSKDPDDTNIAKALANDPLRWRTPRGSACNGTCRPRWPPWPRRARSCKPSIGAATTTSRALLGPDPVQRQHAAERSPLRRGELATDPRLDRLRRELVQRLEHGARHHWQEPGQLAPKRAAGRGPLGEEADRDAGLLRLPPLLPIHRAGRDRIGSSGSTDALAFKNPDGSVIVQVYNKTHRGEDDDRRGRQRLSQALYRFDVPAHGWATLRVAP